MIDLMDATVIGGLLRRTPGGVTVLSGAETSYGHFEHVPGNVGDSPGVLSAEPSVVIPSEAFTAIGLDASTGRAVGIGEAITVDGRAWYVRGVEPGLAPGEIRVLLANR